MISPGTETYGCQGAPTATGTPRLMARKLLLSRAGWAPLRAQNGGFQTLAQGGVCVLEDCLPTSKFWLSPPSWASSPWAIALEG